MGQCWSAPVLHMATVRPANSAAAAHGTNKSVCGAAEET